MSVAVAALNHEKAQLEDNANQKISALENQVLFVVAVKFLVIGNSAVTMGTHGSIQYLLMQWLALNLSISQNSKLKSHLFRNSFPPESVLKYIS